MKINKIKSRLSKYGFIRSILIIVKKFIMQPLGLLGLYNKYYTSRQEEFEPGTREWLIATEAKYGGRITTNQHNGGDRKSFWWHNYSPYYKKAIKPFIKKKDKIILVEVGIFMGTGVAMWSELFQNGRIIGLDINLENIENNMEKLKDKGAFKNNNLELYEFDQYKDNKEYISQILKGDKADIVIDDGNHKSDAILKTLESFLPFLSDDFVYIVEDNNLVHKDIREKYPNFDVYNFGEIVIIKNKQ